MEFQKIDHTHVALVGGKGAALGELSRIEGVRVPAGFCVTTNAFERAMAQVASIDDRLDRLSRVDPDDARAIQARSAEIRAAVEGMALPDDVVLAITDALSQLGAGKPCAVRSSATAEDTPGASFAGQYDSYLNLVGPEPILEHVKRCWASLFSERAVAYRLRAGRDDRAVQMAVVVQAMVLPRAAGVMFTADPVTGNRKVASVEATLGLGEAFVSGRVNADTFAVRGDELTARAVVRKPHAVHPAPGGGTETVAVARARQDEPALTDRQVVGLVHLGRRIEAHFGHPQDIEWCRAEDGFWIVQSRPITTLFPTPETADAENHVYVSVGHQQMMTEAMRPLGVSVWQLTAMAPMHEAGGRLFVDVTQRLASPSTRDGLIELMGRGDPLTADALQTLVERGDFLPSLPTASPSAPGAASVWAAPAQIDTDPAIVTELIERNQASLAVLKDEIQSKSGPELFDYLQDAFAEHKRVLADPLSIQAIMAGMQASWWLNERLEAWLGEKNAADTLTLSAPGNVTSEMGLALLDLADALRRYPRVLAFLRQVEDGGWEDDGFLSELTELAGGREAQTAIRAYLERYGMRCPGEIDITRPRWSERPGALVPMILANVRNFAPGEARRRLEQGLHAARAKERELLERVHALADGEAKATEVKRMIDRVRTFSGYREYPKYGIVSRYFVYKQALLREAERLVRAGALGDREDIFYLSFSELRDVARGGRADQQLIHRRKEQFTRHQALTPPRVLTSDGEVIAGSYRRRDLPAGALAGLGVCAGTVEGRARVIHDVAQADLETGDILVTISTDPSWTPLFLGIKGLVTEVGGLMTHGAVIAREYGLPAVVAVQQATRLIEDGQRIRVHGTEGYVEILAPGQPAEEGLDHPPTS
ncbi:MAG TPA: rifamycin-inactivating phosphotransferase [Solirubrobacteraceae bacterium]|nr:rifamycin-inactivating phosphotransferase [Solirubrobacteraceae bacterium]